jgi:Ca2+-binding RTX toxin-like protein
MSDTVQPDPNLVVITAANQYLDLSSVNDTVVLATGAEDEIDMIGLIDYGTGFEGSGDTVVVTGDKSNVIIGASAGLGQNNIELYGLDESVTGQVFPGSNDTIVANGKGANINIGGYNSVVLNGTDNVVTIHPIEIADDYDPMGGTSVVANGAGKETVTGGGADFTFTGGSGRYSIDGGSAENAVISGGAGGGVFIGGYYYRPDYLPYPYYPGNNVITAGLQASTLIGGLHGSSLLIANGSSRDVLIAGEYGSDTLSGGTSTANNIYEGYSGTYVPSDDPAKPSLVIEAGSGNDTLIAGLAAETLTGGAGYDQFRFLSHAAGDIPPGGDQTVITDFTPGIDKIDLRGFSVTSEQVVAGETIAHGSTYLSLPDGEKITLLHITDLSPKDFTES